MRYIIFALALTLCACASTDKKAAPAAAKAGDKAKDAKPATKPAATAAAGTTAGTATCKIGDAVRTISIINSGDSCTVQYTKDGETNDIGAGAVGGTFCQELQARVKNNLASAGYACE